MRRADPVRAAGAGRRGQEGFTLVELLTGIILAAIFALALFGFLDSGVQSAQTHQSQAIAQSEARGGLDRLSRELRQAVSADGGITPPVQSISPTAIVFHVDNNRNPSTLTPRPQRVRYQITGGNLVREFADPVGTAPPYTYGAYRSPEVVVRDVANTTANPMFAGIDSDGRAMAASITAPTTVSLATVTVRFLVNHRTGRATSILELTTDVSPRNPRTNNR
jgi:prepilin-type N-terminal cleavage/methylation domain-containing protein